MMSSHQLAIAKATFSAGLLRPDPTSLNREEIALFHSLLNQAIIQCTPRNVQKCKHWILENIAQSTVRFAALGKYLTALTTSFTDNGPKLDSTSKREPSVKRKRLHLLFLVNDILFHSKYRVNDASICGKVQPILVNLLGSAASFTGCPKHHAKIQDLLTLWEEKDYYSREYVGKLREAVKNAAEAGQHEEASSIPVQDGEQDSTKSAKTAPYVMPAMHGDVSTPWFDLPAGNLMPHIVPNSTRPINPDQIKPLQFVAGPADERLVSAVKSLLDDVQKIFGGGLDEDNKTDWDIDELGQPIILDEITGDVLEGEGYYGWSRTFCEKMKRRRKGLDIPDRDEGRSRSQSRSLTPDRKRRRYSQSDDSSLDNHRDSRARRRYSSSRSRSPEVKHRSGFRSRSRSYSKSPERHPLAGSFNQPENPSAPRANGPPAAFAPTSFNPLPHFPQQQGYSSQQHPPPPPMPYNAFQGNPANAGPGQGQTSYGMNVNNNVNSGPVNMYHAPQLQGHSNNYNGSAYSTYNNGTAPPPPPPAPRFHGSFPVPPPNPQFQQYPGAFPPNGRGNPPNFIPPPPPYPPPQQGGFPSNGTGGWQAPQYPGNGRGGFNNHGQGGRGSYRGSGY